MRDTCKPFYQFIILFLIMPSLKKSVRSYFSFSKKELNGILLLCIMIALIMIFPYAYRSFSQPEVYELNKFAREIEAFKASALKRPSTYKKLQDQIEKTQFKTEYFDFDPNGLAEKDWRRLGLSSSQIKVIKNYEVKGGKFYKKEDLKRIYSISAALYSRIEPYIHINTTLTETREVKAEIYRRVASEKSGSGAVIEINSADSAQMVSIRGIGPVFASRIIRYRDRLSGFYSKEQLKEVYGLDSLKYSLIENKIRVDASLIHKLNINTLTFDQIKRNPYLSFKQMNAMIQYRKQHGDYLSLDDLKKVDVLNEEIIRKIEPYLLF